MASKAMTLVFDQPNLPFPGGVLTPAVACGEALARRLIHSGVKFSMGEWYLGSQHSESLALPKVLALTSVDSLSHLSK